MFRKSLLAAVTALALAPLALTVPASARTTPTRVATTYYQICSNGPGLCWRDPSDGGSGTKVVLSAPSSSNSEHWAYFNDSSACSNTGVVSYGCTIDGVHIPNFIVNQYAGDHIDYFPQQGSGKCIKFSSGSNWKAIMGSCGTNGSLMVNTLCNSHGCYFLSLATTEALRQFDFICGAASGSQIPAGPCVQGWLFHTARKITANR